MRRLTPPPPGAPRSPLPEVLLVFVQGLVVGLYLGQLLEVVHVVLQQFRLPRLLPTHRSPVHARFRGHCNPNTSECQSLQLLMPPLSAPKDSAVRFSF